MKSDTGYDDGLRWSPLAAVPAARPTPPDEPIQRCVLVVDDEPAIVELLEEALIDAGYDVIPAFDGRQALELAKRRHPDVVLSDVMMPRLSGTELVTGMRATKDLAATPVILMSAATTARPFPNQPMVTKPFDLDRLLELIDAVSAS